MELKEFKEEFNKNFEMFNESLTKYITKEKPNIEQIKMYAKDNFKWFYPNAKETILVEIVSYGEWFLELYNTKKLLQKELFKIHNTKRTLQKELSKN